MMFEFPKKRHEPLSKAEFDPQTEIFEITNDLFIAHRRLASANRLKSFLTKFLPATAQPLPEYLIPDVERQTEVRLYLEAYAEILWRKRFGSVKKRVRAQEINQAASTMLAARDNPKIKDQVIAELVNEHQFGKIVYEPEKNRIKEDNTIDSKMLTLFYEIAVSGFPFCDHGQDTKGLGKPVNFKRISARITREMYLKLRQIRENSIPDFSEELLELYQKLEQRTFPKKYRRSNLFRLFRRMFMPVEVGSLAAGGATGLALAEHGQGMWEMYQTQGSKQALKYLFVQEVQPNIAQAYDRETANFVAWTVDQYEDAYQAGGVDEVEHRIELGILPSWDEVFTIMLSFDQDERVRSIRSLMETSSERLGIETRFDLIEQAQIELDSSSERERFQDLSGFDQDALHPMLEDGDWDRLDSYKRTLDVGSLTGKSDKVFNDFFFFRWMRVQLSNGLGLEQATDELRQLIAIRSTSKQSELREFAESESVSEFSRKVAYLILLDQINTSSFTFFDMFADLGWLSLNNLKHCYENDVSSFELIYRIGVLWMSDAQENLLMSKLHAFSLEFKLSPALLYFPYSQYINNDSAVRLLFPDDDTFIADTSIHQDLSVQDFLLILPIFKTFGPQDQSFDNFISELVDKYELSDIRRLGEAMFASTQFPFQDLDSLMSFVINTERGVIDDSDQEFGLSRLLLSVYKMQSRSIVFHSDQDESSFATDLTKVLKKYPLSLVHYSQDIFIETVVSFILSNGNESHVFLREFENSLSTLEAYLQSGRYISDNPIARKVFSELIMTPIIPTKGVFNSSFGVDNGVLPLQSSSVDLSLQGDSDVVEQNVVFVPVIFGGETDGFFSYSGNNTYISPDSKQLQNKSIEYMNQTIHSSQFFITKDQSGQVRIKTLAELLSSATNPQQSWWDYLASQYVFFSTINPSTLPVTVIQDMTEEERNSYENTVDFNTYSTRCELVFVLDEDGGVLHTALVWLNLGETIESQEREILSGLNLGQSNSRIMSAILDFGFYPKANNKGTLTYLGGTSTNRMGLTLRFD